MDKKNNQDLAFIIHGVVIANGFWKLGELVYQSNWLNVFQVFSALIIAIIDWYIFYEKIEKKLPHYPFYFLIIDYLILGCFVLIFNLDKFKGFSFLGNIFTSSQFFWGIFIFIWMLYLAYWTVLWRYFNAFSNKTHIEACIKIEISILFLIFLLLLFSLLLENMYLHGYICAQQNESCQIILILIFVFFSLLAYFYLNEKVKKFILL